MIKKIGISLLSLLFCATLASAGGWNADKGLDKVTLKGQLVCVGCSLKKLDGANAQCNLFAHHAIGFKTADGLLWSFVDNAKGHDVIRAHKLVEKGKNATVTGWIYPAAHFIEIDSVDVEGVTMEQIQIAGLEEDKLIAKRLATRTLGQAPTMEHEHGSGH
jgi:hypothetical protein